MNKYKRMKKFLIFTVILLIIFMSATGFLIYANYDYLAFKYLMTRQYIYTDTLDKIYDKYLKINPEGNYMKYFDDLVIALSTIGITFENKDKYTYLYIPETYAAYKSYTKDKGLQTETYELDDKTLYMCLTNFSTFSSDMVKKNLDTMKQYDNIIIDLRNNSGGRVDIMQKISSYFLPKGDIIAKTQYRNKLTVQKSRTKQILTYDNIIILQSSSTASASENLIVALKENLDNVTLIGETTFGKGIGQMTIPLKEGYAVKATTLQWLSPKGNNIHETGINPDIPYTGPNSIDFALEYLKEK